jgi:hypothetical protein
MLISPSDVISVYPSINQYHETWTQTFVRHEEVRLIDYVTSLKRRLSEIIVSKLCCRACHVWITTVQDKIARDGGINNFRNPWKKLSMGKGFYEHGEAEQSVFKRSI